MYSPRKQLLARTAGPFEEDGTVAGRDLGQVLEYPANPGVLGDDTRKRIPTTGCIVGRPSSRGVPRRLHVRSRASYPRLVFGAVENQNDADSLPLLAPHRLPGTINRQSCSVLGHEQVTVPYRSDTAASEHPCYKTFRRIFGFPVHNPEHVSQRPPPRILQPPPGQHLGSGIHECHVTVRVGGDHHMPDAVQRC